MAYGELAYIRRAPFANDASAAGEVALRVLRTRPDDDQWTLPRVGSIADRVELCAERSCMNKVRRVLHGLLSFSRLQTDGCQSHANPAVPQSRTRVSPACRTHCSSNRSRISAACTKADHANARLGRDSSPSLARVLVSHRSLGHGE